MFERAYLKKKRKKKREDFEKTMYYVHDLLSWVSSSDALLLFIRAIVLLRSYLLDDGSKKCENDN